LADHILDNWTQDEKDGRRDGIPDDDVGFTTAYLWEEVSIKQRTEYKLERVGIDRRGHQRLVFVSCSVRL
jgi:hypothetical protein